MLICGYFYHLSATCHTSATILKHLYIQCFLVIGGRVADIIKKFFTCAKHFLLFTDKFLPYIFGTIGKVS